MRASSKALNPHS
jgi:hypothetical protein